MVTLTSAESKRLIAKAVAALPQVRRAYAAGLLVLQVCSSNGYLYEELTGKSLDKAAYVCGYINRAGPAALPAEAGGLREYYFERGEEKWLDFATADFSALLARMTEQDVIVKSGNVLDSRGRAGVLLGDALGGEWGLVREQALRRGVGLIVPMTLNKSAPIELERLTAALDGDCAATTGGGSVRLEPLPGLVLTELEALEQLAGVTALPLAMNGLGCGEGTVTLLLSGEPQSLGRAGRLLDALKGEPPLYLAARCRQCVFHLKCRK